MIGASAARGLLLVGVLSQAAVVRAETTTPSGDAALPEPLVITSDSDCPSGPAITAELEAIRPLDQGPSGTVRVRATVDELIVDLVADNTTERRLPVTGDCSTRATTVALVIATWTGDLSTAAAAEPDLHPTAGGLVASASARAPAALPASVNDRELGAGLLLSLSGGLAPGVEIGYLQTRAPRGLGWQLGVMLPAWRQSSGPGMSTRWTRTAVDLAANGRITLKPVVLSAAAGLVTAYTWISARGYTLERDARALTFGAMAEARAAISWGRLRLWAALRGGRWLLPQSITIETQSGDRVAMVDLPSWDVQWALGLSYLLR